MSMEKTMLHTLIVRVTGRKYAHQVWMEGFTKLTLEEAQAEGKRLYNARPNTAVLGGGFEVGDCYAWEIYDEADKVVGRGGVHF